MGLWGNRLLIGCLVVVVVLALVPAAFAQNLRYDNHRKVGIPEYAAIRIGPFYSNIAFTQTAGYRWTRSRGSGTDYTFLNRRGSIKEDGSDFPLISTLDLRNYLFITEQMDVDLSVRARFEHYPLETQEDDFYVTLPEEGIDGSLSSSFQLTPVIRGTMYEKFRYQTDYIDTRGMEDVYGGQRYEYFRNSMGVNMDWRPMLDHNVALTVSRRDEIPLEDEFKDQERVSYNESMAYSRLLFPGLIAGVMANYTQFIYDSPDRQDANTESYSFFIRGGRGEEKEILVSGRSTLTLSLGYAGGYVAQKEVISDRESESDSAGVVGQAELKTQLTRSMAHSISAGKSVRGGFSTAFETVNDYVYNLRWAGRSAAVGVYSRLTQIEPSSDAIGDYSNWQSGLNIKYPITERMALLASSVYTTRDNQSRKIVEAEDTRSTQEIEEQDNDYTTWTSRVGTGFRISEKIAFNTHFRHTERYSGSNNLEYERDTFVANLTYRHVF